MVYISNRYNLIRVVNCNGYIYVMIYDHKIEIFLFLNFSSFKNIII